MHESNTKACRNFESDVIDSCTNKSQQDKRNLSFNYTFKGKTYRNARFLIKIHKKFPKRKHRVRISAYN